MEYPDDNSQNKLPYIPEVDTNILDYLSDQDLINICQTETYYRELCQDDSFWKHRIRQRIGSNFASIKPEHLSWRQWYFFWRKNPYDKISQTLNLKPIDAYYRIISEKGIYKESRFFQSINITLGKAFNKKDNTLVKFYWQELLDIVEKYKNSKIPPSEIINYPLIIELAITNGYVDFVSPLIDIYYDNLSMFRDQDSDVEIMVEYGYNIIELLVRYELEDLLDRFDPNNYPYKSIYYLTGLIKAHRNEEVIHYMYYDMQLDDIRHNQYYKFIIDAYLSGNQDIISELVFFATGNPDSYRFNISYDAFLRATGEKESYEGNTDILQALIDIKSPKVYDYYLESKSLFDHIFRLYDGVLYCPLDMKNEAIIDFITDHIDKFSMKDCPADYIASLVNYSLDKGTKRKFLMQIVKYGRYDVLHLIEDRFDEIRLYDIVLALNTAIEVGYIDLYVWLLRLFIKRKEGKKGDHYLTLASEGEDIPDDGLIGALEAYIIAHQLAPLIDELDDIDYMPLLIYANKYVTGKTQLK